MDVAVRRCAWQRMRGEAWHVAVAHMRGQGMGPGCCGSGSRMLLGFWSLLESRISSSEVGTGKVLSQFNFFGGLTRVKPIIGVEKYLVLKSFIEFRLAMEDWFKAFCFNLDLTSNLKHPNPSAMVRSVLSPPFWVKVNADVGYSSSKQKAVSGIIIRDENDQIRGSCFRIHNLFSSIVMAEAEDYSKIRPVTRDVKALSRSFLACCFNFTGRGGNTVAHTMAKEGMKSSKDRFWFEDASVRAIDLAASDLRIMRPP
ncbi:hypothetical protein Goshw_025248 [Gossypium schwendimanii]|uniref:RNase H type-1 domain-containing protein n=1 Tax=Gossypium schwendimanii TaxID=34291 RepID=A0A7J9LR63_GOSSC|nr:hypothetical protein [Gossypium schwendimanii]